MRLLIAPYRLLLPRSGRWLFSLWILASLVWAGSVAGDVYYRAQSQAEMSQEVERDLDLIACSGRGCDEAAAPAPQEKWGDIAVTYLQFGYATILEWMILPPVAVLLVGFGAALMRRRPTG